MCAEGALPPRRQQVCRAGAGHAEVPACPPKRGARSSGCGCAQWKAGCSLCGPLGGWGVLRMSACLPPLWEVSPAQAWSPPFSLPSWHWARCWVMLDPPPHTVLLLSATPSSSAKPPPPRPLALPGGTDALLLTSTYTLPPPRARSAACLSCTFQQSPGALKRPLRSYPEGGGEGGWGPGRGAGLERPPCCVCAGRGGMRGGS